MIIFVISSRSKVWTLGPTRTFTCRSRMDFTTPTAVYSIYINGSAGDRQPNSQPAAMLLSKTLLVLALAGCVLGASLPRRKLGFNSGRIVGGTDARKGQFPYQLSLQWVLLFIAQHSCGGSLLNPTTVLTAGHCITEVPGLGHYQAVAGEHDLSRDEGTEQTVRVSETIVHPDYPGGVAENDIAIFKLQSPMTLNDLVTIIPLPAAGTIPTGQTTLSGWGTTSTTGGSEIPNILQTVDLPIVPYDECYALIGGDSPLNENMICTGPLSGGQGACQGDSGGPLVQVNADGVIEQIGVVSFGFVPCGTVNQPSVFTRVSAFIDFINANLA